MNLSKCVNFSYSSYLVLLTIIWMVLNYGASGSDPYTGQGIRWGVITLPLLLLIVIFLFLGFIGNKSSFLKNNMAQVFLLGYVVCIIPLSILHSDLKLLSEVIRWALPLYFIIHYRINVSYKLLNFLFVLALVIVVVQSPSGASDFGFLPGQAKINLDQGLWWRISIWTYNSPPYSAAFSLAILLVNMFFNKSSSRYIFYFLSLYFIMLSASRTSYFILFAVAIFMFMMTRIKFGLRGVYLAFPIVVAVSLFLLQAYSEIAVVLSGNEIVNSAVLRSVDGDVNDTVNSRLLIIAEHYNLATASGRNPVLGIGSKVNDSPNWTVNGGSLGGTADSYITHLMARDGIAVLLLFLSYYLFVVQLLKEENVFGYLIAVILLIFTVAYGAWLNFTSPVFLMYCGLFFLTDKMPLARYRLKVSSC